MDDIPGTGVRNFHTPGSRHYVEPGSDNLV